ncbi:MAG: HPr family phosphocarrier protein [Bacteroidetes bacterium]|nr:HPr family phosphocarrier protein [Bacteroidota bacterium]
MKSIQIRIKNQVGLHARPATLFVQMAQQHEADITVSYEGKTVNAKSMLGLLSLGVSKDSIITIAANGSGEELALSSLTTLIENNFGE